MTAPDPMVIRVCETCSLRLCERLERAVAEGRFPVSVERVDCLRVCGFRPRAEVILPEGGRIRYAKEDYDSGGARFVALGDDPIATLLQAHLGCSTPPDGPRR